MKKGLARTVTFRNVLSKKKKKAIVAVVAAQWVTAPSRGTVPIGILEVDFFLNETFLLPL